MATGLAGLKHRLDGLPLAVIEEAAARFDEIARQSAGRAVGGQMRLHAQGGRRPLVRFRTKAREMLTRDGASVLITGDPAGVWTWIESGTRVHPIGLIRGNQRVILKLGEIYVTGPIRHPGTTGKRAWTRAVAEFESEMQPVIQGMLDKAVAGV